MSKSKKAAQHRLSDKDVLAIHNRYAEGQENPKKKITQAELAKQFGVSTRGVNFIVQRMVHKELFAAHGLKPSSKSPAPHKTKKAKAEKKVKRSAATKKSAAPKSKGKPKPKKVEKVTTHIMPASLNGTASTPAAS